MSKQKMICVRLVYISFPSLAFGISTAINSQRFFRCFCCFFFSPHSIHLYFFDFYLHLIFHTYLNVFYFTSCRFSSVLFFVFILLLFTKRYFCHILLFLIILLECSRAYTLTEDRRSIEEKKRYEIVFYYTSIERVHFYVENVSFFFSGKYSRIFYCFVCVLTADCWALELHKWYSLLLLSSSKPMMLFTFNFQSFCNIRALMAHVPLNRADFNAVTRQREEEINSRLLFLWADVCVFSFSVNSLIMLKTRVSVCFSHSEY